LAGRHRRLLSEIGLTEFEFQRFQKFRWLQSSGYWLYGNDYPGQLVETGLKSKIAVVCGASRGLGRAAAESLAAEGTHLAIVARHEAALTDAALSIGRATGVDVFPLVCDVSRPDGARDAVRETARHFGGLDILVTNAGGPRAGTFAMLTEDDFVQAIDLTFMSVVRMTMEAVPLMRKRGGGRIIHITSVSVKQPVDNLMLSNALRPAVVGFAKTLASELASENILVNCVCPGYTRTDRVMELNAAAAAREGITLAAVEQRLVGTIPMRRLGEPHELASLITFLASERASYITGTTLQVDGGYVRSLL
jgi:3-oxoacyl-[acyl-carrier protein] reductase